MRRDLMPTSPREAVRNMRGADPLAPSYPRVVEAAINRESGWALANTARAQAVEMVTGARLHALEYAAEVAIDGLGRIARYEAMARPENPVVADQMAGYRNVYHSVSLGVIARMPDEF